MVKIETKANRAVMWVLIGMGLIQVFMFCAGFSYGFVIGLR